MPPSLPSSSSSSRWCTRADPVPLVVLTQPFLPRFTERLLQLTHRYLPGASPPLTPVPTSPTSRRVVNLDEHHLSVIASTHEFTSSLAFPLAAAGDAARKSTDPESSNSQAQQVILLPPKASPHRYWIQVALVCVFAALTLVTALLTGGYLATAAGGQKPLTVGPRDSFWRGNLNLPSAAIECGEDAVECRPMATEYWLGLHCVGQGRNGLYHPAVSIVRGSNPYTADSHICASAVHAGLVSAMAGGCFEVRLAGQQPYFNATNADAGFASLEFGWAPRSVQYRAATGPTLLCPSSTASSYWAVDLVVSLAFFVFYFAWRVDLALANWLLVQFGFAYCGYKLFRENGQFMAVTNNLLAKQFTLVPVCYMMFHLFAPAAFCPDPTKFPIEALAFSGVFFVFIHLHDLELDLNLDGFALSSSLFRQENTGFLTLFILLVVVLVMGLALQARILWRARLAMQYSVGTVLAVLFLLTVWLPSRAQLSLHVHHFFLGLCICALARGQRWYSMVFQAIGLALFVEGLAVYNIDPLFDVRMQQQVSGGSTSTVPVPTTGYQLFAPQDLNVSLSEASESVFDPVVFTRAVMTNNGTTIELEWALPSELAYNWECDEHVGFVVPEIFRSMHEIALNDGQPLPVRADRLFYVTMNGVLQDNAATGGKAGRRFVRHGLDPATYAVAPLVFDVVLVDDRVSTLVKLPMPAPFSPTGQGYYPAGGRGGAWDFAVPYHADNASLCDRMFGIYSRVQEFRINHTELVWWTDRY